MALQLGNRARKGLRYLAIGVFAAIVFVFALQMTFPYDRVKDKVVDLLSGSYDVSIGSVERGFMPGRVYFKAVTLRTRAASKDEQVTTFYIEKLEIDLGLLALLRSTASVSIDAKIGAGHIKGSIELPGFGKKGFKVHAEGTDLPGASLPIRMGLGLPMTGKIEFSVDLDLPNERNKAGHVGPDWTKAEGSVELSCPSGCTFGDGKTRLKPLLKNSRNQVMVGDGIDFGKVNIDTLFAKAVLTPSGGDSKPAKLEVTRFDAKSLDGDLKVEYAMTLAPEFGDGVVNGCLRFRGSEALLKREPKTFAAIQTTGAELRPDGMFHIKLTDKFKDMKRLNMQCGPGTSTGNGENFGGTPGRPNLTVQPDEPIRPIPPPTQPPPLQPPPPSAAPAVPAPTDAPRAMRPATEGEIQPPPPSAPPEGAGTAGAGGAANTR
ncbi:MAG: hypothetical protein JWO36_6829 [Myxococcales bacterium]|nr:hypothetical protein [Myxococcales bacterium]